MKNYNKRPVSIVLCIIVYLIVPEEIIAQNSSVKLISETVPQLKKLSAEINQNLLPLLALIKKIEESGPSLTFKVAKIIKPQVSVKEADNLNSITITEIRMNEEFQVIEEHDKWYKIRTSDNREGWITEGDAQVIVKQSNDIVGNLENLSKQDASAMLSQINRYKVRIEELFADASLLIKKIEEEYGKLSSDNKKSVETNYQDFKSDKEKIEKYYAYAVRFTKPYENILISPGAPEPSKLAPGDRFKGTISADIGRSSYSNMTSNSTTSSRLAVNGRYQIDKNTRLDFILNNQNELIQTAFSNSTIEAGLTRQFSDKMVLGGNFNYNIYNDKATDNNSFGLLRTGLNAVLNPTRKLNFYANASFQLKDFKTSGNNDYQGIMYNAGTNLTLNSKNNIRIQVQGNLQTGEKDYLNFTQISPQLVYTRKKSKEKFFSLNLDYDVLAFAGTNSFNDYNKYKTDIGWRNKINDKVLSRNMNLTYKQYPNNNKQDYYRMGYVIEKRSGLITENRSSITSFSYIINVIANREDNLLRDYLDLRWDRSKTRPKGFGNMNILTRFWNNFDMIENDTSSFPDHFIDFYGAFGPCFRNVTDGAIKIESLRIGFVAGGHLFFNFDEDSFNRNGNSVRGGLTASSNIKILKAVFVMTGSYERSLIICKETSYNPYTGDIVYGENLYRKPSSFQFNFDYRQPVKNNWDVHLNLSTYDIRTDATYETSILPVEKKSNLRLSGGLIYRFSL